VCWSERIAYTGARAPMRALEGGNLKSMSGEPDPIASLGRLGMLRDLAPSELQALVAGCEILSFREGTFVIQRGQENTSLYIVVDGEASVMIEDAERAVLSRGSFFGEVSALLGEPTTADIIARSALRCLVVPAERVEAFLVANPRVMFRMLQVEARRLRTADEVRT
jgi:CRP/FNR family cyclic AMP-dependent transcriptional regulator